MAKKKSFVVVFPEKAVTLRQTIMYSSVFTDIKEMNNMEIFICKRKAALLFALALFFSIGVSAQILKEPQTKSEPISQDLGYQGNYHIVKSPNLSPIEKLMRNADFCQIDNYGYYMIIPNGASELDEEGEMPVDEVTSEKVKYLFKRDVVHYYEVEEEYNTPLKLKRFKESDSYKDYVSCLEGERKIVLDHSYYIIFDVDAQYDLNSHTFTLPIEGNLAGQISVITSDKHFDGSNFITPKLDEDLAYKIETNTTELIVFVKFTGGIDGYGSLECKPSKVYITDKKTGQIYYEYTPNNMEKNTETSLQENKDEKETVVVYADKMPEFPGGDKALMQFFSKNIKYPKKAREDGVQGRVTISFVVDVDGNVKDPQIKQGLSPECNLEAIRLVNIMPNWKPGTLNGKPVNVRYTTTLTFRLQ